jgi:Protein of unknown function (DUF1360)
MPSTGYSPHEQQPLAGYAMLTLIFNGVVAALVLVQARSRRSLPEHVPVRDIALLGVGTFKLSRLISKDKVTSFVRSPFTRYQGPAGPGEVSEEPRGHGLRYVIGELLVCPYCMGQWVGTGLLAAYLYKPRETRVAASVLATVTIADYLQQAWVAVDRAA